MLPFLHKTLPCSIYPASSRTASSISSTRPALRYSSAHALKARQKNPAIASILLRRPLPLSAASFAPSFRSRNTTPKTDSSSLRPCFSLKHSLHSSLAGCLRLRTSGAYESQWIFPSFKRKQTDYWLLGTHFRVTFKATMEPTGIQLHQISAKDRRQESTLCCCTLMKLVKDANDHVEDHHKTLVGVIGEYSRLTTRSDNEPLLVRQESDWLCACCGGWQHS